MALASTDPRVLMGQAKCFSCLSPKLQYQLRTYLLAKLAMGDTSITGVQALSVASTCFSCFTHGELLAAKQYLMAVWLGLDTTKTGIIAQAATAACDYACLTPVQAEQVRTYLLAVTAGVATDAAGVQALEVAAKCFECPTNKRQLEMQVYLLSTLAPGAPTTPAAIMQAAGCFLACVPAELHEALSTSLFAQVANRSTPPCVTPTAPSQPVAFSKLDNILKISWTQPANSGSLIQSYTVSYGTTQGGPYTATKTVQAGTKQAILTGLTSGTTYYFVVAANSFSGCSSASSAEGSAQTTGSSPLSPITTDWVNRVMANGDPKPATSVINAYEAWYQCLVANGLDGFVVANCLFNAAPTLSITNRTPFFKTTGNDPWTIAGGGVFPLVFDINGVTTTIGGKYLVTGIIPSTAFPSANSAGIATYCYLDPGTASGYQFGSADAGNANYIENFFNGPGSGYFFSLFNLAAFINWLAPDANNTFNGWVSSQRTAVNAWNIYAARSNVAHSSVGSNAAAPSNPSATHDLYFMSGNINGVAGNVPGITLSFAIILNTGLTAAQDTLLFNCTQTLLTTIGGGFR